MDSEDLVSHMRRTAVGLLFNRDISKNEFGELLRSGVGMIVAQKVRSIKTR